MDAHNSTLASRSEGVSSVIEPSARAISIDLLERTGEALRTGDFDPFADCFLLPQQMELFGGGPVIHDRGDLRTLFDNVRRHLSSLCVTHFVRECKVADFHDDKTIYSTHVSTMVAGSHRVRQPYPVFSVLRFVDGAWKIAHSMYAIAEDTDHEWAFRSIGDGSKSSD